MAFIQNEEKETDDQDSDVNRNPSPEIRILLGFLKFKPVLFQLYLKLSLVLSLSHGRLLRPSNPWIKAKNQ